MRSLFRITVVDPKAETIVIESKVIAQDKSQALLKADFPGEVRANPDKFDILVEEIGAIRPKKETQKVEVVKTED